MPNWMLGKREGMGRGIRGPSPCGGDSTHYHKEKNSLLWYQSSHWFVACLVYAYSGIKRAIAEAHMQGHSQSQNLLQFLWKQSVSRIWNTHLIIKWKCLHFHRLLEDWMLFSLACFFHLQHLNSASIHGGTCFWQISIKTIDSLCHKQPILLLHVFTAR